MHAYVEQFSSPKGKVNLELREREVEERRQTLVFQLGSSRHPGLVRIRDGVSSWSSAPPIHLLLVHSSLSYAPGSLQAPEQEFCP